MIEICRGTMDTPFDENSKATQFAKLQHLEMADFLLG